MINVIAVLKKAFPAEGTNREDCGLSLCKCIFPPFQSKPYIRVWLCFAGVHFKNFLDFVGSPISGRTLSSPGGKIALFFFFFLLDHARGIWKFPNQESYLSCSCHLGHSCGHTESLSTKPQQEFLHFQVYFHFSFWGLKPSKHDAFFSPG